MVDHAFVATALKGMSLDITNGAMRLQQELQQILQVHALPSLSHTALAYLEACMLASLTQLLVRLKYLLRRLGKSAATSGVNGSSLPYGQLLLLLHLHDGARFYRLSSFLGMEEARKKARESASGVSELDMLNDNDEPTHDAENFDDAWLAAAPTAGAAGGNTAASTSVGTSLNQFTEASQATIPHSILSLDLLATYEEYSSYPLPMSVAQAHEAIVKQALPLGFLEHLRRLQSADNLTRTMSPSEYIQYSEARAQAGFTHHKLRSKRFREFITPHLAANEIPQSDELFESLAFLAQESVVQLVDQGKYAAQKRVNDARRVEMKSRGVVPGGLSTRKGAPSNKKKKTQTEKAVSKGVRDQKAPAKVGGKAPAKKPQSQASKKTVSAAMQREKDEKQRQLELKMEEQNRHPEGPFTASAGTQVSLGLPGPTHPAADVDNSQSLATNSATEHSKVDGTAPLASIAGRYDVLLGDFEQGYHDAKRGSSKAAHNVRRKRRFVDIFR